MRVNKPRPVIPDDPDAAWHGTVTGYTTNNCRCFRCTLRFRDYMREYRAKNPHIVERQRVRAIQRRAEAASAAYKQRMGPQDTEQPTTRTAARDRAYKQITAAGEKQEFMGRWEGIGGRNWARWD